VKQLEDVLVRYEKQIRGGFMDELGQVFWHLDSEHRVIWIIFFKKVALSRQDSILQREHASVCEVEQLPRQDRLTSFMNSAQAIRTG
jgi:hypothetical protein